MENKTFEIKNGDILYGLYDYDAEQVEQVFPSRQQCINAILDKYLNIVEESLSFKFKYQYTAEDIIDDLNTLKDEGCIKDIASVMPIRFVI